VPEAGGQLAGVSRAPHRRPERARRLSQTGVDLPHDGTGLPSDPPGRTLDGREPQAIAVKAAAAPELWQDNLEQITRERTYVDVFTDEHDTGYHDHDVSCGAVHVVIRHEYLRSVSARSGPCGLRRRRLSPRPSGHPERGSRSPKAIEVTLYGQPGPEHR
jgi:hypothetical protein